MEVKIHPSWKILLNQEFEKDYFHSLVQFIKNEYQTQTVYPVGKNIFYAFDKCPFDQLKVVILGQDPYHGVGQAHGLCFSVPEGIPFPPSLLNIFKEIKSDLNKPIPPHGNLTHWADQGVLLLNSILTVRAHQAGSHQNHGWEIFTDQVIKQISNHADHVVFMLWGAYAQKKEILIDASKHLILKSAHPSPLSAYQGFIGNRHFSKCNAYLESKGKIKIDF